MENQAAGGRLAAFLLRAECCVPQKEGTCTRYVIVSAGMPREAICRARGMADRELFSERSLDGVERVAKAIVAQRVG